MAGKKRKVAPGDVASNRQARFRYELLDKVEAGIVLQGTEVKALRTEGEAWLHNLHIPPYKPAAQQNHQPDRSRKLLLHRREIERLLGRVREKGLTVVPTRVYFSGANAKVELALAKGKDVHDKRESIREREQKREMDRAMGRRR